MDFKTDRFQRIEAIFHEALAVEGDARAQLIDAQCGEDSSLAAQVRLLLSASEREEQRERHHRVTNLNICDAM